MRIRYTLWILAYLMLLPLVAQEDTFVLNNDFQFVEGVYLSQESLMANTPDIPWEDVDGEMVQLPEDFRVQIAGMGYRGGALPSEVYAISLDGYPYLFVGENNRLEYHEFAGLRDRGALSYLEYQTEERVTQLMHAYNPSNGQPFRTATIERDRQIKRKMLVDMVSGKQYPFTQSQVEDLIAGENDLLRAVLSITPNDQEREEKLRQAIRLFNQRHPVYLPIAKGNE